MAWPSSQSSGYTATGNTTIRWGTDGLLTSPAPSTGVNGTGFYVVTKFSQKQLVEAIKLPNGTGITTTRILLVDGTDWNITVRDESTMSPPLIGGTVTIVDAGGLISSARASYSAVIIDNNYEAAPKQAGERTITVERLRLIEG